MELSEKIVISWKPLTTFAKSFILDIWQGSDYASDLSLLNLIFNSFSSTWDFMAYTLTEYNNISPKRLQFLCFGFGFVHHHFFYYL